MLVTGVWRLCRCELYSCFMGSYVLYPESCSYSVDTVHARAGRAAFKALCILGVWLNKHTATITAQFVDGLYGPSLSAAPPGFVARDEKCTRHEKTLNTFHAHTLVCVPWRTSARSFMRPLWESGVCFSSGWVALWVGVFRKGSSRNRTGQDFCVFKRKPCGCCFSHLQKCFCKGMRIMKKYPLVPGKCRWGKYVEFFEAYWNTRNQCWFQSAHSCFRPSIIKSHCTDADLYHPLSLQWAIKTQNSSVVSTTDQADIWQWLILSNCPVFQFYTCFPLSPSPPSFISIPLSFPLT